MKQNKKVVITGGAGFIGSHLAQELAKENEVIILDDFSSGKAKNISGLRGIPNVKVVKETILNLPVLHQLFNSIDYVFHLAADPSVVGSIEEPLRTNEVNVTGTLNVLLAARDRKVKKVIYASSSAVYADAPVPNAETMIPNPTSPYALTKLVGEHYCRIFTQIYGLPTLSLRYFNVYGPRQDTSSDYAAVIPRFIHRILTNQPPIVYGDGEQTRDFIFVGDVVEASILAAEQDVVGEVINIACGMSTSISHLADKLITMLGKNLKPSYIDPQPGDIKYSVAEVSKGQGLLGFKPQYSLEEGLSRTIAFFKKAYPSASK
jgi:UDP-glucose 4-epimerase